MDKKSINQSSGRFYFFWADLVAGAAVFGATFGGGATTFGLATAAGFATCPALCFLENFKFRKNFGSTFLERREVIRFDIFDRSLL